MKIDILEFLLENDVVLKSNHTGRCMTADTADEIEGEFVVCDTANAATNDLYRGSDFERAMIILEDKE